MTPTFALNHPYLNLALLLVWNFALIAYTIWSIRATRRYFRSPSEGNTAFNDEEKQHNNVDPYEDITSPPEFEWSQTPPLQIRAFKPKFHMTMGMHPLYPSEPTGLG